MRASFVQWIHYITILAPGLERPAFRSPNPGPRAHLVTHTAQAKLLCGHGQVDDPWLY